MSEITVPLLDLKAQYAPIREEIRAAIDEVCDAQWFVLGPNVTALEEELAAYTGAKHAIGCGSGSDAILLALMALDIGCNGGHNGRVLCPSYTFFATGGSTARLGAFPVYVDIDPVTYNMDPEKTREAARNTENLAAIMPVHLFGQCVDMTVYREIADEFGVPLIEDAAQAIGQVVGLDSYPATRNELEEQDYITTKEQADEVVALFSFPCNQQSFMKAMLQRVINREITAEGIAPEPQFTSPDRRCNAARAAPRAHRGKSTCVERIRESKTVGTDSSKPLMDHESGKERKVPLVGHKLLTEDGGIFRVKHCRIFIGT